MRTHKALRQLTLGLIIAAVFMPLLSLPVYLQAAPPTPLVVDSFESPLTSGFAGAIPIGFFNAQDGGSQVAFSRTTAAPALVPGSSASNNVLKMDFKVTSYGVVIHGFENVAVNTWVAQDWSAYAGVQFWLYGTNTSTSLFMDIIDNRPPGSTVDNAERYTIAFKDDFSGWKLMQFPFETFTRKEIGNGAPNDGYTLSETLGWAFGSLATVGTQSFYIDDISLYGTAPVRPVVAGWTSTNFDVTEGHTARVQVKLSKVADVLVTVNYGAIMGGSAVANQDFIPVQGVLTFAPGELLKTIFVSTLDNSHYNVDKSVLLQLSNVTGGAQLQPTLTRVNIKDNETYDPAVIDDFQNSPDLFNINENASLNLKQIQAGSALARPGHDQYENALSATSTKGRSAFEFGRRFPTTQDWSNSSGLSFWYYGRNSGREIDAKLLANQAADPGPTRWKKVWSDEFNSSAGTAANPAIWGHEVGDGTAYGIPGWGNDELEYYTNGTNNVAQDGAGNLVFTVKPTDANSNLSCYYGPCKYTSARLLTAHKVEVAFGRVEARIKTPRGAGLWPAFWMLGTDIEQVGWPQTGEIDIMENVGRLPNQVFGTLHGPGYSGGNSYGKVYDLGKPLADEFHTFAVEWQPDKITWFIDGTPFFTATAQDAFLAGKQWVYNHPFYILLNVAIGGNFGGAVDPNITFPQTMKVDYVRLYQAPDTTKEFATSFKDNFSGWKQITLPFSKFKNNDAGQLNLTSIRGYSFEVPGGMKDPVLISQVKVQQNCGNSVNVTSVADSGAGSLREALALVCNGGVISFDKGLTGKTIQLQAELAVAKSITIDGNAAPNLALNGGGSVRDLVIAPKQNVTVKNIAITNGYGFELAGGILNLGTLTLDGVTLSGNNVTTSYVDFWKGGAGVYNGDSATLTVKNSTVSGNYTNGAGGGGIYGFFNTLVRVENSTVTGNTASDVGGGFRTLGDVEIINSTISGNISTGWHGGGIFHTDGVMNILNSTIANNSAPGGTSGGVFVGTFTAGSPTLTLTNTIIANNSGSQCFVAPYGSGTVTLASGGHNLSTDGSCNPVSSDLIVGNALLGPLANNGGSTQTHALLAGSPAIDTGDDSKAPATDQRGVVRPKGSHSDIGAYEYIP